MTEKKPKKPTKQTALEIYVGEDKMSLAQSVNAQVLLLSLPTPEKYIMQREGRGGLILEYVETNYVIGRLNATFMFDWDSEIVEQIIDRDNNQIAMKVRLTARFADGKEVRKDAWGGSAIKHLKDKKTMVDLADDLKSAEGDGIKKAASMIGICWDVYSGLTSSGKKWKKTKAKGKDNGFTDYHPDDKENQFRTISIMINNKRIMHTKYEALDRFKAAKSKLGDELYYKILGENGYEKSSQIPQNEIQKLYDAMATAYKETKIKKVDTPITEEKDIIVVPPEPVDETLTNKLILTEDQSLGFTAEEVEKEEASEFPPITEPPKEEKPEMPLQREIMSLAGYEAMLVDKYEFMPDQICKKLKDMFGEDELIKLTRKQTLEAIEYFKSVMKELDKKAAEK